MEKITLIFRSDDDDDDDDGDGSSCAVYSCFGLVLETGAVIVDTTKWG